MNMTGLATTRPVSAISPARPIFGQTKTIPNRMTAQQARKIEEGLQKIMKSSPEDARRLTILLRTLLEIAPEQMGQFLDQLQKFLAQSESGILPSKSGLTAPIPAQPLPADFTIHLEFSSTINIETVVAELREAGLEVHTLRAESTQTTKVHVQIRSQSSQTQKSDPLVLDLGLNGIHLSSMNNGERFDINADGKIDQSAFVRGDDAFLALDRNRNGFIDDGRELFGDQRGAINGFAELAKYDENGDRIISVADSIFRSLLLLHDKNGDGRIERSETSTLMEKGIAEIYLSYKNDPVDDQHGNTLAERSLFLFADGKKSEVADAWIGYR